MSAWNRRRHYRSRRAERKLYEAEAQIETNPQFLRSVRGEGRLKKIKQELLDRRVRARAEERAREAKAVREALQRGDRLATALVEDALQRGKAIHEAAAKALTRSDEDRAKPRLPRSKGR